MLCFIKQSDVCTCVCVIPLALPLYMYIHEGLEQCPPSDLYIRLVANIICMMSLGNTQVVCFGNRLVIKSFFLKLWLIVHVHERPVTICYSTFRVWLFIYMTNVTLQSNGCVGLCHVRVLVLILENTSGFESSHYHKLDLCSVLT